MKTYSAFLALGLTLASAPFLKSAQQVIHVVPASIAEWTVVGTAPAGLVNAPALVIPAGAQLARTFAGDTVALRLSTLPTFDTDPANWTVLEIGPVALVFARDGGQGRLQLVPGDHEPISIPAVLPLDGNGGAGSVGLSFTPKSGQVVVSAGGQTFSFSMAPSNVSGLDAVISAGAGTDFPIGNFDVIVTSADAIGSSPGNSSAGAGKSGAGKSSATGSGVGAVGPNPVAPVDTKVSASSGPPAVKTSPRPISLVVFSPPAFRLGRAAALRAGAATNSK